MQALQDAMSIPRDTDWLARADARISTVRAALGERAWEEASSIGRAMTLEEPVEVARERAASVLCRVLVNADAHGAASFTTGVSPLARQ